MQSMLLTVALVVVANGATPTDLIRDGSILVLHNSNKLVGASTTSTITHVAMIINLDGKPIVYEATPSKVRRIYLSSYYSEISKLNRDRKTPMRVELSQPREPYSAIERARMVAYLESQIGRRYSVRGYLRKDPGDGIHCAALVGSAVSRSGACKVSNPYRQSPASLMLGLRTVYRPGNHVPIRVVKRDTTLCEKWQGAWSGFKQWCCWSFVESYRFCF